MKPYLGEKNMSNYNIKIHRFDSKGRKILENEKTPDSKIKEIWAEIVYHFAASYKKMKNDSDKDLLIESLKTLWIGRFVSYAIETKDMDVNKAEHIIQKSAEIFEKQFNYLRSIY